MNSQTLLNEQMYRTMVIPKHDNNKINIIKRLATLSLEFTNINLSQSNLYKISDTMFDPQKIESSLSDLKQLLRGEI